MSRLVKHVFLAWGVIELAFLVTALSHTFFDPVNHPGITAAFLAIVCGSTALAISLVARRMKRRHAKEN